MDIIASKDIHCIFCLYLCCIQVILPKPNRNQMFWTICSGAEEQNDALMPHFYTFTAPQISCEIVVQPEN